MRWNLIRVSVSDSQGTEVQHLAVMRVRQVTENLSHTATLPGTSILFSYWTENKMKMILLWASICIPPCTSFNESSQWFCYRISYSSNSCSPSFVALLIDCFCIRTPQINDSHEKCELVSTLRTRRWEPKPTRQQVPWNPTDMHWAGNPAAHVSEIISM